MAALFKIARSFLDLHQNYMAFWHCFNIKEAVKPGKKDDPIPWQCIENENRQKKVSQKHAVKYQNTKVPLTRSLEDSKMLS